TRAALGAMTTALFDEARGELLAAMAEPKLLTSKTAPMAFRMLITLPPSRLPALRRRLIAIIKSIQRDFRGKKGRGRPSEKVQCALTVALAPTLVRPK